MPARMDYVFNRDDHILVIGKASEVFRLTAKSSHAKTERAAPFLHVLHLFRTAL